MINSRFRIVLVASLAGLGLFAGSASAQRNYTWNNTSTNVALSSSWTPTGFPGSTGGLDNAFFNVLGTFGTSTQFNPDLTSLGTVPLNGTVLNSTANFTGWSFTGTGSTIVQSALTVSGPVTHTINGPNISGIPASVAGTDIPLVITVTGGSTLAFQGASTFTGTATTAGNINLRNGTLVLDNTGTNTNNRLPTTSTIVMNGGTFSALGNSAGTTFNVGPLNVTAGASTPGEGLDTISVTQPTGSTGATVLNFANTGTVSLSTTTGLTYNFVANGGTLGTSASGPQIKFGSATVNVTNGTISNAIVTDASGVNFATYGANGVTAASTTSATSASSLTSATTNYTYTNASGSDSVASIVGNSFNIRPTQAHSTLTLTSTGTTASTAALQTQALMLNDAINGDTFTINASGGFFVGNASTTKYVYVTNPTTTLATNMRFFDSTSPVDIVGPGFVALTGTGSQVDSSVASAKINLIGGTLRASSTQMNFTKTGGFGVIAFRGGVLEITGGNNGAGVNADFTRSISATNTAGGVNWNSSISGDSVGGSGGFSAFGANASVNIGGASALLTWGVAGSGFVQDGYALKFGSTQSNAVLQWQNPLALDNGTPGNYLVREINVTAGIGGDKTQMSGPISGSSSTDLLKTGTGTLELLGMNTYQGNTLIQGGTLIVGSGGTIGTGDHNTGNVVVGNGATLAAVDSGTMTIYGNGSASVIVNPGGAIRGGNPTFAGDALGTLSTNSNIVINSSATANGILRVEAARTGAGTANSSLVSTTGIFNLNPGSGNKFTIDLVNNAANHLVQGESYSITLANAASFQLNGTTLGAGATIASSNYTLQSSAFAFSGSSLSIDSTGMNLDLSFTVAPVPEPAAVLAIAVGALGLGGLVRRRMRRVVPTIAA